MKLFDLINNYKNQALNLAVLLVACFIALNIFQNQNKEMAKLKAATEEELKKSAIFESISKLNKKAQAYKVLLPAKDESTIINNIGTIAKESNIKIVSLKPAMQQKQQYYSKNVFDLTVSSPNYSRLGQFISRLEGSRDVYIIESISLQFDNRKQDLSVNVKVSCIQFLN